MSPKKYLWSVNAVYNLGFTTHELWELISSPNNLEKFHPFCNQNPVVKWDGARSIDKIYYYGGKVLTRNFFEWNDGKGYKLLILICLRWNGRYLKEQLAAHWKYQFIPIDLMKNLNF